MNANAYIHACQVKGTITADEAAVMQDAYAKVHQILSDASKTLSYDAITILSETIGEIL